MVKVERRLRHGGGDVAVRHGREWAAVQREGGPGGGVVQLGGGGGVVVEACRRPGEVERGRRRRVGGESEGVRHEVG